MTIEDRIREIVDGYVARMRTDLDAHAQSLAADLARVVASQQEEWRADMDRSAAEAREAEARASQQRHEEETRVVKQRNDDAHAAATAAHDARESRVETLERLMHAFRRIDESSSLTGILGALARGAAAETSRVAILLVDGYMFRTWEHVGFEEGAGPTEMPVGSSGALAAAVALKQTSFVPSVIEGRENTVPGFMRVPAGHTGLIVPLTVGGDVVAVLYADDALRAVEQEDVPLWAEEVQVLARHAALRLENVTSVRTVEVLAGSN